MQTLVCSSCDTKWKRKAQRGRKPSMCPDCKSGKPAVSMKVQPQADESSEIYVEMLIRKYGYVPQKKTTWCEATNHKYCATVYRADYKYRCQCKCHA